MTPIEHLRELACDRHAWPVSRDLAFAYPAQVAVTALYRQLYRTLSGGRVLPEAAVRLRDNTYNWGDDSAIVTEQGDGILFAAHCFGALPGDGVDDVYHLLVGEQVRVIVEVGRDYSQRELVFEMSATAESIDVATDALLEHASTAGLQLVRRVDDVARRTPRRH